MAKALQTASENNLDLVEVAPSSVPPVCKLLDYGRYRYEQTKKERKARKSQKVGLVKEIRLRPRVNDHDLETKIKIAKKLLDEGDKVRVFVVFRGREITHPELGLKVLQKAAEHLKGAAALYGSPSVESGGRIMSLIFSPMSNKKAKDTSQEGSSNAKTQDSQGS